jgi:hypothetical protein
VRGGRPTDFFDDDRLADDIVSHLPYLTGGVYSLEMAMQNPKVFDGLVKASRVL